MKKIQFLAVMALFMTFGCSNEDLINTEQDSTVLEENSLVVKSGERRGNPGSEVNGINFVSKSIENGIFIDGGCLISPYPPERKLLKYGMFSGSIEGYGKINPKLSEYETVDCKLVPNDGRNPERYIEDNMYELTMVGRISLSVKEYCTITIIGNVYPINYSEYTGGEHAWIDFDGGEFVGIGTITSGVGKLSGLNDKILLVYGNIFTSGVNDFTNGKISLHITDQF